MCGRPTQMIVVISFLMAPTSVLAEHTRNILLTGYWPPSSDIIRGFSQDGGLNPDGWEGLNWEGRGYNVYAFFPDCDIDFPMCFGDLEVDYQDTSADFWPIADSIQPVAIMTFSRGNADKSWEIEMNQYNRASWVGDYQAPLQPTPAPPDAGVPAETLRLSTLPVDAIRSAVIFAHLGLTPVFICYNADGGGFLSEFIAYHGVWYQDLHKDDSDPAQCVAAGHIHVGQNVPIGNGTIAMHLSLREVIKHVNSLIGAPGDFDVDGDIDLTDYAAFQDCLTGPDVPSDDECAVFDFDSDFDVDLLDFAGFQVGFTAP